MLEDAGQEAAKAVDTGRGKKPKLEPGLHIVYAKDSQLRICSVGRIWALTKAEASVQVHKYTANWDVRLRVRWMPLFYNAEGAETTEATGGRPSLEGITPKQVLDVVQLHDGVLQHSVARKLDREGWKIPEGQYVEPSASMYVSTEAERIIHSMNHKARRGELRLSWRDKKLDLLELFG